MFTVQLLLLTISLQTIKDVQEPGRMICSFPAVTDCTINFLCTFQIVWVEITQLRIHQKRENRRTWWGRFLLLWDINSTHTYEPPFKSINLDHKFWLNSQISRTLKISLGIHPRNMNGIHPFFLTISFSSCRIFIKVHNFLFLIFFPLPSYKWVCVW